ncbi:hypothetical protein FB466_1355 [Klugiella xanthotipulae]|uniref:Uncharacterized protein n=1 Tax=Klugiella xanthotipulae TaxID=244735 RepID=A0A543HXN9_9MICO|nr:hypothetical protein FB466_1355 [Klugiella xanthotipulae]
MRVEGALPAATDIRSGAGFLTRVPQVETTGLTGVTARVD